jgi:hypothetical protein
VVKTAVCDPAGPDSNAVGPVRFVGTPSNALEGRLDLDLESELRAALGRRVLIETRRDLVRVAGSRRVHGAVTVRTVVDRLDAQALPEAAPAHEGIHAPGHSRRPDDRRRRSRRG